MKLLNDCDNFDPHAILSGLRRTLIRREPTPAEAREILADWWEALYSELVCCRRETLRGQVNHRVVEEDVDHAHLMAVWLRHEARDAEWKADPSNLRAAEFATANGATGTTPEAARAYTALPDFVKQRLQARPTPPDKRTPSIPRPREYMPIGWPPIHPGVTWSMYLAELLSEKRARAGIVEREPGEDREEDEDAAE